MVLLPAKFHKKMWVKRGGFLVARLPPEAAASGARLAGEVERVLYEREVAALKGMAGVWPREFEEEVGEEKVNGAGQGGSDAAGPSGGGKEKKSGGGDAGDRDSDSDDSGLPPLEENPNRRRQTYATSSSESDSDEEEDEEEEDEGEEDEEK